MQVKTYSEIKAIHIDNAAAKGIDGRAVIGKNDGANNFCMRIFEIASGGNTPSIRMIGSMRCLFIPAKEKFLKAAVGTKSKPAMLCLCRPMMSIK